MDLKRIWIISAALLLLCASSALAGNSAYKVSPRIPLDSWVYNALDKVTVLCFVESGLAGMRPLTRLEAARLVAAASLNASLYDVPPKAKVVVRRLKSEFHDELAYLVAEPEADVSFPAKLLRSAAVRYTYQDGKPSGSPGTDASQFALTYNNSGREYDNHNNGEFSLTGDVLLFDQLLLAWQPLLSQREGDTKLTTLAAIAAVSYAGIELSVGRQELWWGPSRHGSLILSNNAKPLDMIRLTNQSPLQLPWIFKHLGPFRFDTFVSRLGEDRVVEKPYFGGLRLNFKPSQYLELGATRTVMFGGKGQPNIDFKDFLTILGGENLTNNDTSNSIAGVDATIIFPLLWGMQIYGELYGEDEANHLPSKNSFLTGLYLPQIEPSGTFSLRVEYADTSRLGGGSPVFYRHGTYKSGYIYEDRIMGHHVGSDSTDWTVELGAIWSERFNTTLVLDYQRRGEALDIQEKHYQASLAAEWWLRPEVLVSARYAIDRVKNFAYVDDDDETFQMATLGLEYRW